MVEAKRGTMKVTRGNVEKYLSDEELATLIEIPLCPCDEHCGNCAERRKVATAASDKGYAAASRDIIDYLRRNGYDRLVNQLSDWLKQKGAV